MTDPLDQRRLVRVHCKLLDGSGTVGTGCLVRDDLLLTAAHVLPAQGLASVDVFRLDGAGPLATVPLAVWRDDLMDAVLVRLHQPIAGLAEVDWLTEDIAADQAWQSCGFPVAGLTEHGARPTWTTVGLNGTLYHLGGLSEKGKELHVGVDDEALAVRWKGVSGAPVFVGGRLAGLITKVLPDFQGKRFGGPLLQTMWRDPGFRLATAAPLLESATYATSLATPPAISPTALPGAVWVLVVQGETGAVDLADKVGNAIDYHRTELTAALGIDDAPPVETVLITDALQSPGRWLQFVQLLCTAPIALFDITHAEPAVMLALGVRSVVRRGVTINCNANRLTSGELAALPFNIKETKQVYVGEDFEPEDPRHPRQKLHAAIAMGWRELARARSRYLDLPAYDLVRCPYPAEYAPNATAGAAPAGGALLTQSAVDRVLMLCPFDDGFKPNWVRLSNAINSGLKPPRPTVRMLDLDSPRLVGQALYEGIRWATTCVVDWTRWRPNVFFELGVRLACAAKGPICFIDGTDPGLRDDAPLQQQQQQQQQQRSLRRLLAPTEYWVDKKLHEQHKPALAAAFAAHAAIADGKPVPVADAVLAHDAIHTICLRNFDWADEDIIVTPDLALQRSVQDPFGNTDQQQPGLKPILFSVNPAYSAALDASVRERWIAAWYYRVNRHPPSQWDTDAGLRSSLRKLANNVLQFGPDKDDPDPHLQGLRKELVKVLLRLKALDTPSPAGFAAEQTAGPAAAPAAEPTAGAPG